MFTTYYQSPVGLLLIKDDGNYINAISFSEQNCEPTPGSELNFLQQLCIKQFDEYFSGKRKIFDLPIKQAGTNFQLKVWHQLAGIPYGKNNQLYGPCKKIGRRKSNSCCRHC